MKTSLAICLLLTACVDVNQLFVDHKDGGADMAFAFQSDDLAIGSIDLSEPDDLLLVDLNNTCSINQQRLCMECGQAGYQNCVDMTFGPCIIQNPGACKPGAMQDCMLNCSAGDAVQICKIDCTWGPCQTKTVPAGCGDCNPFTQQGCAGGFCAGMEHSCIVSDGVAAAGIKFVNAICALVTGPISEGGPCNFHMQTQRCAAGLGCRGDDNPPGICTRLCDLSNPQCPNGRFCLPRKVFWNTPSCWGWCT